MLLRPPYLRRRPRNIFLESCPRLRSNLGQTVLMTPSLSNLKHLRPQHVAKLLSK